MNKKIVTLFALTTLLVLPGVAMAWTVQSVVNNVVDIVKILFGVAAIVYFLWYGVLFLRSKGDPAKAKEGRQALLWGVTGVIVGALALTIVTMVTNTFGLL